MDAHARRTWPMLAETAALTALLYVAAVGVVMSPLPDLWALAPAVLLGAWFQRLYVVGHEAAHRKLWPRRHALNDLCGQLALLPILVPLSVFRAIHRLHHGDNRRDARTGALDVYPVPAGAGPLRRAMPWVLWYVGVFGGGWFLHSLVSVVLFLGLPPPLARKVSPAFKRWTWGDQARAVGVFLLGVGLHVATGLALGPAGWALTLGAAFLAFAWVYSVQLYVYHYRTTMGPQVRHHVRPLRAGPVVRWWLLHLNEHDVHHGNPNICWYALAEHRQPPPEGFAANHTGHTFTQGVLHQLRGPTLVEEE